MIDASGQQINIHDLAESLVNGQTSYVVNTIKAQQPLQAAALSVELYTYLREQVSAYQAQQFLTSLQRRAE